MITTTGKTLDIKMLQYSRRPTRKRTPLDWFIFVINAVMIFIIIALVVLFGVVSFSILAKIDGDSMLDTFHDGDYVLLSKVDKTVHVGNIAVLNSPSGGYDIIKRVIAVGGQSIRFEYNSDNPDKIELYRADIGVLDNLDTNADINKYLVNESEYLTKGYMRASYFNGSDVVAKLGVTIDIPQGSVYVMGDNRNNSMDSRVWGSFLIDKIVGKRYATLKRNGFLEWIFKTIYGV